MLFNFDEMEAVEPQQGALRFLKDSDKADAVLSKLGLKSGGSWGALAEYREEIESLPGGKFDEFLAAKISEKVVTTNEALEVLNKSANWLRKHRGELKHCLVSGGYLYLRNEIE